MDNKLKPFLTLPVWESSLVLAIKELHTRLSVSQKPQHVVTITAEMLLHAIEHLEAQKSLLGADFFLSDTTSVTLWMRKNNKHVTRITGVDFAEALIRSKQNQKIAIIGGLSPIVRAKAHKFIEELGSSVVISDAGPEIDYLNFQKDTLVSEILNTKPDIVLVAFGHGKQEWWISKIKPLISFPTILIGVGGTIDMWGGQFSRAPKVLRTLGLEWIWRLIQEPRRVKRIIQAVIVFPYRAFVKNLL